MIRVLKLRTDVSFIPGDNASYLQVGSSIYNLSGAPVEQQKHWWRQLTDGQPEDNSEQEPGFLDFINLLKDLKAFQNADNWVTYGPDYGLRLTGLQKRISDYPIFLAGDSDLIDSFLESRNGLGITNQLDNAKCIVVLARSTQSGIFNHWNNKAFDLALPTFMVSVGPFEAWVGPWVFPGETPCYNCASLRRQDNYKHLERQLFGMVENEIRDNLPEQFVQAALDVTKLSLIKNLMADEGNNIIVAPIGSTVEYNWLADTVTTHKILRHPKCELCFPRPTKSTIWLSALSSGDQNA